MLRFFFNFIFLLLSLQLTLSAKDININELVKEATAINKKVFIFLHRTDCGYCDSMISFTLDDDIVRPLIKNNFLEIHINIFDDNTIFYNDFTGDGRSFAKHIGYNMYPSSIFLDEQSKIIHAEVGYIDEKNFPISLNYVISSAYKSMDIVDYEEGKKNE